MWSPWENVEKKKPCLSGHHAAKSSGNPLSVIFFVCWHPPQDLITELVCKFLLDLLDLSCLAIVAQGPSHLLIGHSLTVALLQAPAAGQHLLVFGRELKGASLSIHPPNAVFHIPVSEQLQKELIETHFSFVAWRTRIKKQKDKTCTTQCTWQVSTLFYIYLFISALELGDMTI